MPKTENNQNSVVDPVRFASLVANWFDRSWRDLPWRSANDPYAIWIAEVMLQQTTVGFVETRFPKWMAKFPTIEALACTDEQEVLREWEGLGYYSRARNLHRAAKIVVERFTGELPDDYGKLRSLPGIGEYTAGAILAIAFGKPYPAIDVNIRRVLRRTLNADDAENSSGVDKKDFLSAALRSRDPRRLTEGLLELGQTVCTKRKPSCPTCPLMPVCRAAPFLVDTLPVNIEKRVINRRTEIVIVVEWQERVLLVKKSNGLFGGLWLLPTIKICGEETATLREWCAGNGFTAGGLTAKKPVIHSFTNNRVTLKPWHVRIDSSPQELPEGFYWIEKTEVAQYPMPSAHRRILECCRLGDERAA